jgi:uncharacterized coiled-coil protein SlyX
MEINLLFIFKCLFGGLFIFCLGWLNENRKSLKLRITNLEDRVSTNEKRISGLKNKIDSLESIVPTTIDDKLKPIRETLDLMTTVTTNISLDIRTLLKKVEDSQKETKQDKGHEEDKI